MIAECESVAQSSRPLALDVWSDYVCPFCYLAHPPIEAVRKETGERLQVRWRAIELRPAGVPSLDENRDRFKAVFERSIVPRAAELGLKMQLPARYPRTHLAHALTAFARTVGAADAVHSELFRAVWERGENLEETPVLIAVAERAGIDRAAATAALEENSYRKEVLEDEELALRLRLGGAPAMLLRPAGAELRTYKLLEGAQSVEALRAAIATY